MTAASGLDAEAEMVSPTPPSPRPIYQPRGSRFCAAPSAWDAPGPLTDRHFASCTVGLAPERSSPHSPAPPTRPYGALTLDAALETAGDFASGKRLLGQRRGRGAAWPSGSPSLGGHARNAGGESGWAPRRKERGRLAPGPAALEGRIGGGCSGGGCSGGSANRWRSVAPPRASPRWPTPSLRTALVVSGRGCLRASARPGPAKLGSRRLDPRTNR